MALRSLVVKLKALPLRMPGYGAFVPKDILRSSSAARVTDPAKYSAEEMAGPIGALLKQNMKHQEEHEKRMRAYDRNTFLIGVVSFGSLGYANARIFSR